MSWFVTYVLLLGHILWHKSDYGVSVPSYGNLLFSAHNEIISMVFLKVKWLYEGLYLVINLGQFCFPSLLCTTNVLSVVTAKSRGASAKPFPEYFSVGRLLSFGIERSIAGGLQKACMSSLAADRTTMGSWEYPQLSLGSVRGI